MKMVVFSSVSTKLRPAIYFMIFLFHFHFFVFTFTSIFTFTFIIVIMSSSASAKLRPAIYFMMFLFHFHFFVFTSIFTFTFIIVIMSSSGNRHQTETCYLFYGPKNSTLSPHLHRALVGGGGRQKLKEDIVRGAALCVSSITRMSLSRFQNWKTMGETYIFWFLWVSFPVITESDPKFV